MGYDDLHKHFKLPKDWTPIEQSFFNYKRFPRKLKKNLKKLNLINMPLNNMLWYLQGLKSPNYNRFIIKTICDEYKRRGS
jgi:hypothetical protein